MYLKKTKKQKQNNFETLSHLLSDNLELLLSFCFHQNKHPVSQSCCREIGIYSLRFLFWFKYNSKHYFCLFISLLLLLFFFLHLIQKCCGSRLSPWHGSRYFATQTGPQSKLDTRLAFKLNQKKSHPFKCSEACEVQRLERCLSWRFHQSGRQRG